ncbi:alpha/beta hydrolase [Nitratireductor sp. StC3]|uniref:alpha/beta hydrolase family protein n=1 Tax=Nitratireductor sp. StC3 TaxID=2126741 RepID=UPI000D0DF88A|nr:alpha/beta hydrolase [Nitratireductor sp. StC3]PSM19625.1 alpha/beta hydrolase [Nitratireductor sp. StC3]
MIAAFPKALPRDPAPLLPSRPAPDGGVDVATVLFQAEDGFPLRGTLYTNSAKTGPAVLVSSAAAVRRQHYGHFAEAAIAAGAAAVLTYDYRGVGGSRLPDDWRGSVAMADWGVNDMAGAALLLKRLFPGRPLVGIGQSIGGTMLGLCRLRTEFSRYAMVASASGYLGLTDERLRLLLAMNLIGVPISRLLGVAPAWLGIGETLPGPVFRDWARWCRRPGFLFDDPRLAAHAGFKSIGYPLLSVRASDDRWSTERATAALIGEFSAARWTALDVHPADAGAARLGHLGFFRQKNASLWPRVIAWLLADADNRPPRHANPELDNGKTPASA